MKCNYKIIVFNKTNRDVKISKCRRFQGKVKCDGESNCDCIKRQQEIIKKQIKND